ncbi:MAG: TraB/GumN family protein [Deltaproteobacteria bacterium]|nr:TraB/GumN family protein [Deltaproteobacteria bacterium]MDL1960852.1 TraB/GumN family protein [Deltaproteobacteria bacterium]
MIDQERVNRDYPSDVQVIYLGTKEIILIGTAHISKDSVDLVRRVIKNETPDCVCVELDDKRYETLSRKKRWESLDLKKIIRKKQLSTLLFNLMLASYQKKLGNQLGVLPGTELLVAVRTAEENRISIALCDRDVRVTLRRAWHATSFFKKSYLIASLFAGLFDRTEITEEKLNELKKTDLLSELMMELGKALPELKRVLIDERDTFLSERIKKAEGKRIVAVVGAGHIVGIKKALLEDRNAQMEEISAIPPVSSIWKVLGWSVPAIIFASLGVIALQKGYEIAGENIIYWILANGIPSSIGAMVALAHPFTIVSAFAAAPVTSLTPVIGAGYVTAFVQVLVRPPVVREFETVLEDMSTLTGWWKNKLLKVFLAFLLPGLGSMIGSCIGGYEIISNLF